MTDPSSDPSETLKAAVEKFSKFLVAQGYPDTIRWVMRDNILVNEQGWFWVRECETKALEDASLRHSQGVGRNLGVAFQAVCDTRAKPSHPCSFPWTTSMPSITSWVEG